MRSALRLSRLLPLIICGAPLVAQGVSTQLAGRISAKGGGVLAGANVTIRNLETGLVRAVKTDANGRFLASALPVGAYGVTVAKAGYLTATNLRVNLNLGDAAPLNVTLAPESSTIVEVVASVATVDTERASSATYVSPDALANLPILNRSFTSLATLTPQVVVADRGNLAIGGQRGVNTSINIDGGDNNEPFFGGAVGAAEGKTPFTISIEAIREYQVITDGASAEFGRMGGGYVNAITKSGTNDTTGSLFYYARPKSLVARNANSDAIGDFKQEQFGFSLGGPIFKDKLFYFVTYDGQRRQDPVNFVLGGNKPVTLDPANTRDAVLLGKAQNYTPKADSDTLFMRLDWNASQDHQVQLRINQSRFKGDAYTYSASSNFLNTYENSISDNIDTLGVVAQWNWTIGANWLNEFRVNYTTDEMPRKTRSQNAMVTVNNVAIYGANRYPRDYETKRLQIIETISYVTPTLQVKAGVDYNKVDISETFADTWQGHYQFQDTGSGATAVTALNNFRAGNWSRYTQRFSLQPGLSAWEAGKFDAAEKQIAAFVQTDLRLGNSVKVGLGLRWDRQEHPDFPIANFGNPTASTLPVNAKLPNDSQFSPRLSFTWTPGGGDGLVVRANAGRYVSTTPSVFLYQVYTLNGQRMAIIDFSSATGSLVKGAEWDAAHPYVFPNLPTGATLPKSDIFSFSPDFKNPYTDRFSLQVERSIPSGWVLGASFSYARSKQLERLTDINLPTSVFDAVSGRYKFTTGTLVRPNASFARMGLYVSDAEGVYRAGTLSAKYQKDGSPFSAQVFYTRSMDKDNDSNERNFSGYSQQNTQRLGDEWSYSDRDRRNVLTGSFSYLEQTWTGLQFGLSFRYLSGTPYSLLYSKDMNGDAVTSNDRMFFNGEDSGRNSQRRSSQTTIDLKVSRDFKLVGKAKLSVSAEVFNVLNRKDSYRFLKASTASTDAAPATTSSFSWLGDGRQAQVGARLSF